MTADITKLVTLILGISIAGDRLVTLVKSIFPNLAAPPATAGTPPADTPTAIFKKVLLMVIAFLSCWLTAYLIISNMDKSTVDALHLAKYPEWLIGLLASGGSAFWTNVLGYLSGLKDLSAQKAFQAKFHSDAHKALPLCADKIKTDATHKALVPMKTVRFTAAFSGGLGTLQIQIDDLPPIDFDNNGFKDIDLATGNHLYAVSGAAADGPGGGCTLTITGDVIADSPLAFGPGLITPNLHPIIVKD